MKALQRRATGVISMPTKGQPYIPGVEVVVEIIEIVETCRYSTMGMLRLARSFKVKSKQKFNYLHIDISRHDLYKSCFKDVCR